MIHLITKIKACPKITCVRNSRYEVKEYREAFFSLECIISKIDAVSAIDLGRHHDTRCRFPASAYIGIVLGRTGAA